MTPMQTNFYVYADSEEEVHELEQALFDFVMAQYKRGVLVTAKKLSGILEKNKDSILVTTILK